MVGGSVPNARGDCPHVAQGVSPRCAGSVPNGEGSVPNGVGTAWGLSPVGNVGKNGVGAPVL